MTHPTISQLLALGYKVGDRVTGRNISIHKKNKDWAGILTADNIQIQEYTYKSGKLELDGIIHEDGLSWLHSENSQGKQIYFNVNCGRVNAEVTSWKAVFFEEDYGTFEEQQAKIDAIPIKPSVQVQTRKSNHCYFTIRGEETKNPKQWRFLQEIFAYIMGSDPSVKDLPRLMRLSGFDHIKLNQETGTVERVKCVTKYINPDNVYSIKEVVDALNIYAANNGIKPYSEERFKAYQFVIHKLRQTKTNYQHELFNPDFFRTCDESEIYERLQRCKLWSRLVEKKHQGKECDEPETAWTCSLERAKKRVRDEYEISRIPATVNTNEEPLTVQWSRNLEGFKECGRSEWHTAKCPVHHGFSLDSLHIHITSGKLKCHSGCEETEIATRLSQIAKDKGDERWNWSLWVEHENVKEELEPERLNKLSIAANEIEIKHDPIQKDWGLDLNCIQIANQIPAQSTLFLKAPTGKGKSEAIKEILKLYPKSGVVSLTPTITLNRGLCENYRLNFIDDIDNGFDPAHIQHIGLCYPSVWKMQDRLYDQVGDHNILILDELRSGLEFLCLSNECNKENRRGRNFRAFIQLLKKSDLVICADAYMTDIEKDFIKKVRGNAPTLVLNVDPERRGRAIFEAKSKKEFLDLIIQSITDNKSIAIATDSQSLGEEIDELLALQGIETFRHDRKTAGEPENIKFIENPTQYIVQNQQLKTLIWSPSMGQGSSITSCHFSKLFGYNAHLPPANFMQLVGRIRPLIPLYYHATGDKPKDSGCDSWFISEQKAAMFDSVERLHELLDAAIATSEDGERQYNLAKQLVQIVEQRENGDNEILDLVAALRARKAYFTTNRREKIRKQFIADGFEVLDFDGSEELINTGASEAIKEVKEAIRAREAVGIVKAKELTDIEAESLQKRRVRSQSQEFELTKHFFNKQFPLFLDNLNSEQKKIDFFMACLKDKYWLKTVANRWMWQNKDKINNKEFLKIEKKLNQFFVDKLDLLHDLVGSVSQPYRQFCLETGFWERFAPDTILTFSDVLQWVFKVDDVSEILAFASMKDATKEQRREFTAKFIKPLGTRYKRELATHLKFRLQADPVYLKKWLTRALGNALERQGYELSFEKRVEDVRIYKITDSDKGIQIDWRSRLESALNKDANFLPVFEAKPLQDKVFTSGIINTGVYTTSGVDAASEIQSPQGLQVKNGQEIEHTENQLTLHDSYLMSVALEKATTLNQIKELIKSWGISCQTLIDEVVSKIHDESSRVKRRAWIKFLSHAGDLLNQDVSFGSG